MSADNGSKAQEEKNRQELARQHRIFLHRRIGELHAMGKPEPTFDDMGHMNPRTGTFPGASARRQADKEWAERLRAMKS